jgi:hypothetical protein
MQFIKELLDFVDGAAGDDGPDDDFDKIDSASVRISFEINK